MVGDRQTGTRTRSVHASSTPPEETLPTEELLSLHAEAVACQDTDLAASIAALILDRQRARDPPEARLVETDPPTPEESPLAGLDHEAFFDSAPAPLLVIDRAFRVVAASRTFLEITLLTRERVLGKDVFEIVTGIPQDAAAAARRAYRRSLERVFHTGTPDQMPIQRHDLPLPPEHGGGVEERYWTTLTSPVLAPDGAVEFAITQVADVTDHIKRLEAEEIQREAADEFDEREDALKGEALLRALELAAVNQKLQETATELQRRAWKRDRPPLASAPARAREEWRDLEQANETLRETNRVLTRANDGLESFAYMVSHDLKEPVRAIIAYQEEVMERTTDPETKELVTKSLASSMRLARLLSGLLEFGRVTMIDPRELVAVDIGGIIEDELCHTRYAPVYRERGAKLEVDVEEGVSPVLGTRHHVCQVLGNLLINAVRHNDKRAPIVRVSVAKAEKARHVEVRVEDDGPGFGKALLDALGEARPNRSANSTGFGLVIARRAIERLGGTMSLGSSATLGGAQVVLTFRAADAPP